MDAGVIKKYKWLLVAALVILAGIFFFGRMYHNDVKVLKEFSASYEKFDKAMADFSVSNHDASEREASDALVQLQAKSTFRLSSLIKNDGELMRQAPVVSDLAARELNSLRLYKMSIKNKSADLQALAKEYGDLTSQRKAAYARFQALLE